jgi:hypothetical protein
VKTLKPLTPAELKRLRAEATADILDISFDPGVVRTYTLPARIVRRIFVDDMTGCWRVRGANSGNGYAKMSVKDGKRWRQKAVHLVIYELLIGPIPPGKILDHNADTGCAYRDCGCPYHLEPVTVKENTERGRGIHHQFKRRAS